MIRNDLPPLGAGLTVPQMLKASPQHHGRVMKLQVSPFYTLLPKFLQKWIAASWCFSFLAPSWQPRYLILLASFLYKFDAQALQNPKMTPKGSPIPIESVHVQVLLPEPTTAPARDHQHSSMATIALQNLPAGCTAVVAVSKFRNTQYYAVSCTQEATTWAAALAEASQEAITRSMGHAPDESFPASWKYFDSLGASLVKRKDRIRERVEQSNLRELEMTGLQDGGPLPRGYHG